MPKSDKQLDAEIAEALVAPPSPTLSSRICTIGAYLVVLSHELTRYDRMQSAREAKRGIPNIYRLGLLLGAANEVSADTAGHHDEADPAALALLRRSLARRFESDFPPIKRLIKQIDAGTCKIK